MLFPRFRSRERDLRSDMERLSAIHSSIQRAIGEAESEFAGLISRLEDARSRAAFLYGDVIDSDVERDKKSSALIADAERFLVRGEQRRDELDAHFLVLRDMDQRMTAAIQALAEEQKSEG